MAVATGWMKDGTYRGLPMVQKDEVNDEAERVYPLLLHDTPMPHPAPLGDRKHTVWRARFRSHAGWCREQMLSLTPAEREMFDVLLDGWQHGFTGLLETVRGLK